MRRQFRYFKIKRGVLFRTIRQEDKEIEQLVLPKCYRAEVLKEHPGKERTLRLLRYR